MSEELKAWRDTLRDLGVMGFVREPIEVIAMPKVTLNEQGLRAPDSALRPADPKAPPAPRPQAPPRPQPAATGPAPYLAPTDPAGCPTSEAVAGAATVEALQTAIKGCLKCPLGPGRIQFVFGEGDPKARLMFIG
ncbi:MAG TPA: hypothetical protein VJ483_05315, partial [Holophagaceae bacterium]|nr:hypothetical protein [Holophagaceae bacterium]